MRATIELSPGLALAIADVPAGPQRYATAHLQRGLLLLDRGVSLGEEAVGFGVPVLKRGLQTIFPGSAAIDVRHLGPARLVRLAFRLNRVERVSRSANGIVGGAAFYAAKDLLAAAIRRFPAWRPFLTSASSQLRRMFGWETSYAHAGFETEVIVTATIEPLKGRLRFEIDCSGVSEDVTEVVLMHEQGAHFFDRYADSSGLSLQGGQIGCWDEVRAAHARFESTSRRIAFKLGQAEGATLFRGRELVGSRLAWAGFGYSFHPPLRRIHHELTISRPA
jgi:hypothetical protein